MPQSYTPRGFAIYADFTQQDYQGSPEQAFTVQESSLATERKVWIGSGSDRAHLNEDEARRVRDALTEFLGEDGQTFTSRPSLLAQSEEALTQGIHDEMTFVSTPESRMDVARDWARELIESGVVTVAPSLVAAPREALIDCTHRALWESHRGPLNDAEWAVVRDRHGETAAVTRQEAEAVADALLAPGGPVQVAEATPEQAWYEGFGSARAYEQERQFAAPPQRPTNPYDDFTRKEQTGGE